MAGEIELNIEKTKLETFLEKSLEESRRIARYRVTSQAVADLQFVNSILDLDLQTGAGVHIHDPARQPLLYLADRVVMQPIVRRWSADQLQRCTGFILTEVGALESGNRRILFTAGTATMQHVGPDTTESLNLATIYRDQALTGQFADLSQKAYEFVVDPASISM